MNATVTIEEIARGLDSLQRRVDELEAIVAVQQVLTSYGLAADTSNVPAMMALWSEDCVIEIDGTVLARGRAQSRRIVDSEMHCAIQPYSAHVMGPFRIAVNGPERAVATGYQTVYVREGQTAQGRSRVWRQSFGRWELRRTAGRWEIASRRSYAVSHPDLHEILDPAFDGGAGIGQ